jgi:hypothetical protein
MNQFTRLTALFFLIILTSFKIDKPTSAFQEKLLRAKMTFVMPKGFQETEIIPNKQMNYDYAMKNVDRNFEVRLAIRPLDELLKSYSEKENNKKPGENQISPNNFYQGVFIATLMNISGGQKPNGGPFPKEAVKSEFNADWGASSMLEVGKEFGQEYKYCVVVAIHKDDVADAYYFYLANDKETIQELMPSIFHCLKFN